MNPTELRALADALEPMAKAPRFEDFDVPAFCAWVRACADEKPVAWLRPENRLREESTSQTRFSFGKSRPPIGTWQPLYARPAQAAAKPCWCHKCNEGRLVNGIPFAMTQMIVCPICGNKRCPHASDHALACTASNDSMAVSAAPQAEPKREPLSEEQVLILLRSLAPDVTANLRGYTAIVRAVERHHGIGDSDAE